MRRAAAISALVHGCWILGCGGESEESTSGRAPTLAMTAPLETWTWVPFDDAFCADGKPTGLAINRTDRSANVVVYFMGGGTCWDHETCYEREQSTFVASGFTEANLGFLTLNATFVGLLARDDPQSPFRDYSVVALPYCTGDNFTGTRVADYDGRPTHHVGHDNVLAYWKRIVPTFPDAERVVLVGSSAGGLGAGFNWWFAQQAFGDVRVDLIDDSGTIPPTPYLKPELEDTFRASWGLDEALPPGCEECKTHLDALVGWAPREMPTNRAAFLSFTRDSAIPYFLGMTEAEFTEGLGVLADTRFDGLDNVRYFFADQTNHVLMVHPDLEQDGVRLWDWLGQMLDDDPAWANVRP